MKYIRSVAGMDKSQKVLIFFLFVLNLFGWISSDTSFGIPSIIKYIISVSVIGVIIWYKFKSPTNPIPGSISGFFVLFFVIWSVVLLIRSLFMFSSVFYIQRVFQDPYYYIPYLLPVIILFTRFDIKFFGKLFYYSYVLMYPTLIILFLIILTGLSRENWSEQVRLIRIFDIGSLFLLMTAHISKKRSVYTLVLIYYLLWIFLWSYYGRRGMLMESMMILIMTIVLRLRSSFLNIADRMRIYLSVFSIVVLVVAYGYLFTSTYAFERGFDSSAVVESRGAVLEPFFFDFNSTSDWIFGRGLDGTVLRSFITLNQYTSVENGFLTLLMKGGLVYTIPFLLLLLRAIYLGFIRSNNDLAKALASYLLLYFIMLAYFNLPDYSVHYVFVWVSVSACFSTELRNKGNDEVREVFDTHFK